MPLAHVWFPSVLARYPRRFDLAGPGAFPYQCGTSDKHPTANVYFAADSSSWTSDASPGWGDRLTALDGMAALDDATTAAAVCARLVHSPMTDAEYCRLHDC